MDDGQWMMVHERWSMDDGPWIETFANYTDCELATTLQWMSNPRTMVHERWSMDDGQWMMVNG